MFRNEIEEKIKILRQEINNLNNNVSVLNQEIFKRIGKIELLEELKKNSEIIINATKLEKPIESLKTNEKK